MINYNGARSDELMRGEHDTQEPEVLWCGKIINPVIYAWDDEDDTTEEHAMNHKEENLPDWKGTPVVNQSATNVSKIDPVMSASEGAELENIVPFDDNLQVGLQGDGAEYKGSTSDDESGVESKMPKEQGSSNEIHPVDDCGGSQTICLEQPYESEVQGHNNLIVADENLDAGTTNDSEFKFWLLTLIGQLFANRFQRRQDVADINNAILAHQHAAELLPDSHVRKPFMLYLLGTWLGLRSERLGDVTDVEKAIHVLRQALNLSLDVGIDECRPALLNMLGNSLQIRFEQLGSVADIDDAVRCHEQVIALIPDGHPASGDRSALLSALGTALIKRFERQGDMHDIENAIVALQQAVGPTPEKDADKAGLLSNLGMAFDSRFEWGGNIADINSAVLRKQQSVDLTPHGDPSKPSRLVNLANSLRTRFERLGVTEDIDKAIQAYQQAILMTPDGHGDKPGLLSFLGNALTNRFGRLGDIKDINNAILQHQRAVALTPDTHAWKQSRLSNFGNALQARFSRLGDIADINNAILVQQKAVDLLPEGHIELPRRLSNLGNSLMRRFERSGDISDIDSAIIKHQLAVDLTPDGHSKKQKWLINLGISLQIRFDKQGNMPDLKNAILAKQRVADLTPNGHSSKPARLRSLANSLGSRFLSLRNPVDLVQMISLLRAAALSQSGPPSERFNAARTWARLQHPKLEPYQTLINLIPQVVWLGRTVQQRYEDLGSIGDIVMEAVSEARVYDLALEWMEQGRAIVWSQILLLRSPVKGLQAVRPDLTKELDKIARALDTASTGNLGSFDDPFSLEQAAQEHRRLADEWERLLETIRKLPNFQDFLRPKPASALKRVSANGMVVMVNVSRHRSDALILQTGSSSIAHVQLPTLTIKKASSARSRFHQSLRKSGVRVRDSTDRGSSQKKTSQSDTVKDVLRTLWIDVAKPILEYLGYTTPPPVGNLPRITWCLSGALATLPLHASGLYDDPMGQDKLFNYIVSSYTPSLTSLIEGLEQPPVAPDARKILAITQQNTPNLSPLPGTMREVDKIKAQMDLCNISLTRMDGHQATITSVSKAMNTHTWIHLSCHGKQDGDEPTKSAFLLHDGALELAEIMKKPFKHAELAYLSACQTALGDIKLPDEAIHLAAGMFIAGYRSVVATLWAIKDNDAPLVAEVFYKGLLSNPDGGVAGALHEAVRALREKVGESNFLSWVPYIHIGH